MILQSENILSVEQSLDETVKEKIIFKISSDIHNWWRKWRLVDNTLDTYSTRWKSPEDIDFEDYWKTRLKKGEQISVAKNQAWDIEIDIANTSTFQLPVHWLKINFDMSRFAFNLIIEQLEDFSEIDDTKYFSLAANCHDFWLINNMYASSHFLFWQKWKKLVDISNWTISKNYIEQVRQDKNAQEMWDDICVWQVSEFWENIFEATDEQLKIFLRKQANHYLKNDFAVIENVLNISKKITWWDIKKMESFDTEILRQSIDEIHESWRWIRLQDKESTYTKRWKTPQTIEFERYWGKNLGFWSFMSVKRDGNWEIKQDIANTSFDMLTKFWKDSAENSAIFCVDKILENLSDWKELNIDFISSLWAEVHNYWLSNNPKAKNHFILWVDWYELLEIANWNVTKKFIDSLKCSDSALHRWDELNENKIIEASDEEIRDFIINEAIFDLKKDNDVVLYALWYIEELYLEKHDSRDNLLNFKAWIVGFLTNQNCIVDFKKLKKWSTDFFHDIEKSFEFADNYKLKWVPFQEIWYFCCSYEKMSSYSTDKLKDLWVETESDFAEFEAYKKYVLSLQEFITDFVENKVEQGKDTLDFLMNQISSYTSKIWTSLNNDLIIENWNHNKVPIKWIDRIMEKVLSWWFFNGDFRKVWDLARWTLEFDNVVDLYNWLEELLNNDYFKNPSVKILIKDNIWNPLWDAPHFQKYRDINCIIKLGTWNVVELQLQVKPMLMANNKWISLIEWTIKDLDFTEKEKEYIVKLASKIKKPKLRIPENDFVVWHEIYELWRSISDWDNLQKELKLKLNKLLIILHNTAWQKCLYISWDNNTKVNIDSYQMLIRKNLDEIIYPEDMENDFRNLINLKFSNSEVLKIEETLKLIKNKHKWDYRDENTPYYTHCLDTALLFLKDGWNFEDIIILLLHDIIEDTDITEEELALLYNPSIAKKVHILSKFENGKPLYESDEQYFENLKAYPELIKYKAYDRLSNLISLYYSPKDYIPYYIEKTKKYFIPILSEFMPEMVEKYFIVFKFLENHSVSDEELKRIEELWKIREIQEMIWM
jgi:hypothetical protein